MKKSENLSKKHRPGIETNACETGVGIGRKKDAEWDLPVSRKYYAKLKAKVEQIYLDLGHAASWAEPVMKWINLYLRDGDKPQHRYTDERVMSVFFSLRPEIDEAVRRSALARQRAAERRARKLAGEECVRAERHARKLAEEGCVHAGSQENAVEGDMNPRIKDAACSKPGINPEVGMGRKCGTVMLPEAGAEMSGQGDKKTLPAVGDRGNGV